MTAYAAGLRVSEVVSRRADIGSQRMIIRIELGKGRKDYEECSVGDEEMDKAGRSLACYAGSYAGR
jgi:hypothetical protein